MANLICKLVGVRGRTMEVYDTKCVIKTDVTVGSVLTSNATDGEKTIFYIDCSGIQFKESKFAIGYIQMETPSMQMNNQSSNFFSENTFTFEDGKNNLTNGFMRIVYHYICDRVEGYKYSNSELLELLPPMQLLTFSSYTDNVGTSSMRNALIEKGARFYLCPCGYVYDTAEGDPENGVEPGTKWDAVPHEWVCPICGFGKSEFEAQAY